MKQATVWVTSDPHFGHEGVAVKHRGWDNVLDHDAHLAGGWFINVKPDDAVWVLGDLTAGPLSPNRLAPHLGPMSTLPGRKRLITGNHDACWPGNRDAHKRLAEYLTVFESVQQFARVKVNGANVMLSHFPYEGDHTPNDRHTQYRLRDEGLPLLHGHVHDLWKWRDTSRGTRQVNVGVDVRGYAPVKLTDLTDELGI